MRRQLKKKKQADGFAILNAASEVMQQRKIDTSQSAAQSAASLVSVTCLIDNRLMTSRMTSRIETTRLNAQFQCERFLKTTRLLLFLQGYYTRAAGKTSSCHSSRLSSRALWVTGGGAASPALAATVWPTAISCWRRWAWRPGSTAASTSATSTLCAGCIPPSTPPPSWSLGGLRCLDGGAGKHPQEFERLQ